jgi:23S rRNA pseudouridine1911/1915/1917 synthase
VPLPGTRALPGDPGYLLHALRLELDHPRTGERMSFESPLPEDMLGVLNELGVKGG